MSTEKEEKKEQDYFVKIVYCVTSVEAINDIEAINAVKKLILEKEIDPVKISCTRIFNEQYEDLSNTLNLNELEKEKEPNTN